MTELGLNAFDYCTSLISVYIPESVTKIGDEAFFGCSSLKDIHCRIQDNIDKMDIKVRTFVGEQYKSCVLYVPSGSCLSYRNHPIWGKFKNIVIE